MKIGYARVSTYEQSLDLQLDALKKSGCDKIYTDRISGTKATRPGLDEALEFLREGDILVVWRLDRLGRNVQNMLELVKKFTERKIGFISLHDNFDTGTATGKMFFTVMLALSEYERNLMVERTLAGLAAARARGRTGGRKPLSKEKIKLLRTMYSDKTIPIHEICSTLKIHVSTLYKYVAPSNTKHRGEVKI